MIFRTNVRTPLFVRGGGVAFSSLFLFQQFNPGQPVLIQHFALHFCHYLLFRLALIIPAAWLPHEQHAARPAQILVAHLQHCRALYSCGPAG